MSFPDENKIYFTRFKFTWSKSVVSMDLSVFKVCVLTVANKAKTVTLRIILNKMNKKIIMRSGSVV